MPGLSEQDMEKYRSLFEEVVQESEEQNGELCMEDFERLLVKCGHRLNREAVVSLFVSTDTDGDWKIGVEEFLDFVSRVAPSGSPESLAAALRRRFEEKDVNKDGYISLEELKSLLDEMGYTTDEEWIQNFMKDYDTDGDGRMNFEEFVGMFVQTQLLDVDKDDEEEDKETEAVVAQITDILLSADGIRQTCNERGLVEDGSVAVSDLRSVLSEVKVEMSEEDLERSIQDLDRNGDGRINLDEFVCRFEDVITVDTEETEDGEVNGNQYEEARPYQADDNVTNDVMPEEEEAVPEVPAAQEEEAGRYEEEKPAGTSNGKEETSRERRSTDTEVAKLSKTFDAGSKKTRQTSCGDDGAKNECKGVGVKSLIAKWSK